MSKIANPWLLSDADMEDYGFEYSEEEPEEQDVDIENQYYNSKGMYEKLLSRLFSFRTLFTCHCMKKEMHVLGRDPLMFCQK